MSDAPFYEKYPQRSCAVCDGLTSRRLFRQTFLAMSSGSLLQGYDLVVCEKCGFCFSDHIPSQDEFDAHYRDMSKYEYQDQGGMETTYDLARFHVIANCLIPFLSSKNARLFDAGCATGRLLAILRERGFSNVMGLDPSPACAEAAKRLYDVRVATGTLYEIKALVGNCSVDCMILSGVLEHIRDILKALFLMREILSENGLIFFDVPDAAGFAQYPDAPFQQFSTEHINFFSEVSLENLMRRHGFIPVFSERAAIEQSFGTVMPSVMAIFRKTNKTDFLTAPIPDDETAAGLLKYIDKSQKVDAGISLAIEKIVASAVPVIVWGVGTHTLHLLAKGRLGKANIRAFVDSNRRYQGKRLNEIPILSPHELKGRSEAILLSSRVFQASIEKQIREELGLKNEIIKLYGL
ncbi:MAG: class I SAM-dependent methyltransferase [Candidatus Omnitrophica bacterium]|nr:class I SAM-dependent methyltransferase [Candidatus Omnitrophota bacterium]